MGNYPNPQLAPNSVFSGNILDGTIATGDLADGAVTSLKIADGTIVAGDIADGTITSLKIADGTIVTTDLANAAVTNAKLASDTARANLLTNGGFEIWQRGNGPFTASGTISSDRWYVIVGGGSTTSVSRDTANVDTGSQFCAVVTHTHVAQSTVQQVLETFSQFRGRTLTYSVRVKTSVANSVRLRVNDGVTGPQNSGYHTGSGQYETITLTYAVAATATSFAVNVEFNASGTYYIDNAMLVVGAVAADYAPLHPADDLARCLRYYRVWGGLATNEDIATGMCVSTTVASIVLGLSPELAVSPTQTLSAPGDFAVINSAGSPVTCTAVSAIRANKRSTVINGTVASGLVAGNGAYLTTLNTNARLNLEANP